MAQTHVTAEEITARQERLHRDAMNSPVGFERAIVDLLNGWMKYAEMHTAMYSEPGEPAVIGADGALGPHWEAIGKGQTPGGSPGPDVCGLVSPRCPGFPRPGT